mmetsp:Transcript_5273/g.9662  ORF Transcript_5273/g.9662 Transcript_5273/m.9662 type:complete len:660 (-) Transcript_5273:1028-3007(-)
MASFGKYRLVAKKGEGTFSEVIKAQSMKNGEYVAIKCMKNTFDSIDQVNSLREIQALRRLNSHPNIIELQDVLFDRSSGRLALVFELFDMNIYELIRNRKQYLPSSLVKSYMYQLLTAIAYMHRQNIFHRDVKPENVLVMGDKLKLADFGSCRGKYSKPPFTEYISTRWYRAPESLLTNGYYDYKMDLWGVGCVFFEIISLFPLFPGTNELDQIEKVHTILGTPSKEVMSTFRRHSSHIKNFNFQHRQGTGIHRLIPHASKECVDVIKKLLVYDPQHRISAHAALRHAYFYDFRENKNSKKSGCGSGGATRGNRHNTATQKGGRNEAHKSENKSKLDGATVISVPVAKTKVRARKKNTKGISSDYVAGGVKNKNKRQQHRSKFSHVGKGMMMQREERKRNRNNAHRYDSEKKTQINSHAHSQSQSQSCYTHSNDHKSSSTGTGTGTGAKTKNHKHRNGECTSKHTSIAGHTQDYSCAATAHKNRAMQIKKEKQAKCYASATATATAAAGSSTHKSSGRTYARRAAGAAADANPVAVMYGGKDHHNHRRKFPAIYRRKRQAERNGNKTNYGHHRNRNNHGHRKYGRNAGKTTWQKKQQQLGTNTHPSCQNKHRTTFASRPKEHKKAVPGPMNPHSSLKFPMVSSQIKIGKKGKTGLISCN